MSDCIFCKIAGGEIETDFVFEDGDIVAFKDISPKAPVHVIIIPRRHINAESTFKDDDRDILGKLQMAAQKIADSVGVKETGYRLICNQGKDSGQEVEHLHWHLLGGRNLGRLLAE